MPKSSSDSGSSWRPPKTNGWAPWVGLVIAVLVPTTTMILQLGEARAQVRQLRSEVTDLRVTVRSDRRQVAAMREDLAVIKAAVQRMDRRGRYGDE